VKHRYKEAVRNSLIWFATNARQSSVGTAIVSGIQAEIASGHRSSLRGRIKRNPEPRNGYTYYYFTLSIQPHDIITKRRRDTLRKRAGHARSVRHPSRRTKDATIW